MLRKYLQIATFRLASSQEKILDMRSIRFRTRERNNEHETMWTKVGIQGAKEGQDRTNREEAWNVLLFKGLVSFLFLLNELF